MLAYRSAKISDHETICAFPQNEEELYYMFPRATFPLTADQIEKNEKNRLMPTVILSSGEIAAYTNLYDFDGNSCWLGNVIVSPQYRGKGVAKFLLEVMCRIAQEELGVQYLKLVCHNTNTKALLLYTKMDSHPSKCPSERS